MLAQATSIARPNLISLGTCMGKFSKSGKFKLGVTCLDWLAKYAKYKVGGKSEERVLSWTRAMEIDCWCSREAKVLRVRRAERRAFCPFLGTGDGRGMANALGDSVDEPLSAIIQTCTIYRTHTLPETLSAPLPSAELCEDVAHTRFGSSPLASFPSCTATTSSRPTLAVSPRTRPSTRVSSSSAWPTFRSDSARRRVRRRRPRTWIRAVLLCSTRRESSASPASAAWRGKAIASWLPESGR